jgi:acyl carrier protein
MDSAVIKNILSQYISDTFIKGQANKNLGDADSFFENDIIDSTGVLELVLFIEENFHFRVEDEEIIPENLDSINNLVTYIQSKTTGS